MVSDACVTSFEGLGESRAQMLARVAVHEDKAERIATIRFKNALAGARTTDWGNSTQTPTGSGGCRHSSHSSSRYLARDIRPSRSSPVDRWSGHTLVSRSTTTVRLPILNHRPVANQTEDDAGY